MKANTIIALKKIIKETVEKEVARQLKVVIEEIVNPTPTNNSQVMVEDNLPSYMKEPKEEKKLAKDPVLNKILNETQGGIAAEPMPTMGGGTYTTERMGEIAGGAPMQPTGDMPDFMKKAMSGHSAKVVKAIENKHGTKS
tara:strand:- start:3285 stop:3704 length:420 start_codon:yes stop_codon:yes gene_type:complete